MTKYKIKTTSRFRKELRKFKKRGADMRLLGQVIYTLAQGLPLADKYRNHSLSGNFKGYMECHIQPDWLLIYKIENDTLIITLHRTGTHSDMFKE